MCIIGLNNVSCSSCKTYCPTPKSYCMTGTNDTIPQLDSAQILDYIRERGDIYHMVYCYTSGCHGCEAHLPEFMNFVQANSIPYSIMIAERAADSLLVTIDIRDICRITQSAPPIIILSDSLYEVEYRYSKPQTERHSLFITYGHNRKGDCNKYACYLEKCVPNFTSYWHPRILLYHVDKGVIRDVFRPYEHEEGDDSAIPEKERKIVLDIIKSDEYKPFTTESLKVS